MSGKTTGILYIMTDSSRTNKEKAQILKEKIRKTLLGSKDKNGLFIQIVVYTLLICIGFVYIYPLLYMFITSMMPLGDLLDSSIKWIPSQIYIKNYLEALSVIKFRNTIFSTLYIAFAPTLFQVVVCSMIGYGFAVYNFRGKKILMALMIFTFIIPPQITMMPTYVLYTDLKLLGSMKAFVLPAMLGQGFKSAIFILIYYQFFRQIPKSLFDAAKIDGAGHFGAYFRIALPSAVPAVIVVFLFSFVWYWNETYLVGLFLGNTGMGVKSSLTTLLLELTRFEQIYDQLYPVTQNSPNRINEAIKMAGTMIAIAPLLIAYFFLQKYFVESVDRTGITGE